MRGPDRSPIRQANSEFVEIVYRRLPPRSPALLVRSQTAAAGESYRCHSTRLSTEESERLEPWNKGRSAARGLGLARWEWPPATVCQRRRWSVRSNAASIICIGAAYAGDQSDTLSAISNRNAIAWYWCCNLIREARPS